MHSIRSLSPMKVELRGAAKDDGEMRVRNTFLEFGDTREEDDLQMRIMRSQTWNMAPGEKSVHFQGIPAKKNSDPIAVNTSHVRQDMESIRRIQSMVSYASTASFPMYMYMLDHLAQDEAPFSLPADAYPPNYRAPLDLPAPTTMMLRNFPRRSTQKRLLASLDESGFTGQYDFVYMPFCFDKKLNLGYAFINFRSSKTAYDFYVAWHKQCLSADSFGVHKTRPLNVSVAQIQGRVANMQRVLKECKVGKIANPQFQPVVYDELGNRLDFGTMSENQRAKRCQQSRMIRTKDHEPVEQHYAKTQQSLYSRISRPVPITSLASQGSNAALDVKTYGKFQPTGTAMDQMD